jgi:predicted phage baseplate assembly protein
VPIRPPALDDRNFDDLVNELVARIPSHTPEWTNARLGDPGRTLIELFAWLADTLLYRANLIPERQRLAFLRLLGVQMRPAAPARGLVTIGFDDKQMTAVQVVGPRATVTGPVNFETAAELTILPVAGEVYYKRELTDEEKASVHDLLPGLVQLYNISGTPRPYATTPLFPAGLPDPKGFDLMSAVDHALWIALVAPKKEMVDEVRKSLDSQALSVGFTPAIEVPPLFETIGPGAAVPHTWQVTTRGDAATAPLLTLDVVADSTGGLRRTGVQRLLLPRGGLIGAPSNDVRQNLNAGVGAQQPPRIDDPDKANTIVTWLRLQPVDTLHQLAVSWMGINAVAVEQLQTIGARIVGQSDGTAEQEIALPVSSVERASFALQVEEPGGGFTLWQMVDDLATAGRDEQVYLLDAETGTVRFGDGVRGRIPQAQGRLRVAFMRAGGGSAGNLPPGAFSDVSGMDALGKPITVKLKVTQTQPTNGGDDAETMSAAEQRIPALFRDRNRAVTEQDYQRLALETPGVQLGRVEVMPRFKPQQRRADVPGVVSVMVLPFKSSIGPPNPRADRLTLETVHSYLADRKPIASELYVIGCEYVPISIAIGITLVDGASRETTFAQVRETARVFLWPLPGGGMDGAGWRPGRAVRDRELDVIVARVPGVDTINGVNLFELQNNRWRLVQNAANNGPAEIQLKAWQLPELLNVVVVTDANPATTIDGVGSQGADNGVAVPVVPKTC